MKKWFKLIFIAASVCILSACVTTALYGEKFKLTNNNQYTLQIAFGGLPITPEKEIELTTRKVLEEEANKFMLQNPEFVSYKVVSYSRKTIPSAIVYVVEFEQSKT